MTIAMIKMLIFSLTGRMTVSRNFRTSTTSYSNHPTIFNYLVMMMRNCRMTRRSSTLRKTDFTGMYNTYKSYLQSQS